MMVVSREILEKTCKNMIETILLCLEKATKGTIYSVGPMPQLQAVRITSGIRNNGEIQWGLPQASDYNFPGKNWEEYRDHPGKALEAMGWCVERQKSWTSDNPYEDIRSVRKQLHGEVEDFHHMEPVLVRKKDLYGEQIRDLEYPLDWQKSPIWQSSEYVVVAVIKIHFVPQGVRRGDRHTRIIKKLSRTLGTELLSLHLRETLSEAQKELSRQRLQTCNELADQLRNALMRLGFIFPAINAEMSFLREQWEAQLKKALPEMEDKQTILARLNEVILLGLPKLNGAKDLAQLGKELMVEQEELATLFPLPQQGEQWFKNKIQRKWHRLLAESHVWDTNKEEVYDLLERLQKAIWLATDQSLSQKVEHIPEDLRTKWTELAYVHFPTDKLTTLGEVLEFLNHPALDIPHKQQCKRVLSSLKFLVEVMPEIESRVSRVICSLKNGDS